MNRFVPTSMHANRGSRGASPVQPVVDWMEAVYGPLLRSVGEAWTRALDPAGWPAAWPRPAPCKQRCEECGEEEYACDRCACEICDADLAVMAYPGELRQLPITIENTRSHERIITPEISGWTSSRGDRVEWPTRVTPNRIVLPPCSEKTISVRVHLIDDDVLDDKAAAAARLQPSERSLAQPAAVVKPVPTPVAVPHPACTVYYADLRLAGGDLRPIRIAVALRPETCGAYLARCGCRCCAS